MQVRQNETHYRWYILALSAVTNCLAVAMPIMSLSVLFKEISTDLNLDMVQIGLVWGLGSLPSVVTYLVGGAIGDRLGPKRILTAGCVLAGLAGALRGLAYDFNSLAATVLLVGFIWPLMTTNAFKMAGIWFSGSRMGLASGILSMGMALGFIIGSLISATLLSPMTGGWRHVMFLYGLVAMLLAIPWSRTRSKPVVSGREHPTAPAPSIWQLLRQLAGIRQLWLLGFVLLGVSGSIQGTLGYVPLYLRGRGWSPASADAALATFHAMSLIFVVPMALWSDRLGTRKKVLLVAASFILTGIGLLSVVDGWMVWGAVGLAGCVRDGFMAVIMTMIIETEGVSADNVGTATGLVFVLNAVGNLVAPPLGNTLGTVSPGLPFVFWAALTALGLLGLTRVSDRPWGRPVLPAATAEPLPPSPEFRS